VNVVQAEIAAAVRANAPSLDVSTLKDFQKTLLAARNVALNNSAEKGFSALHVQSILTTSATIIATATAKTARE
jgi:hypothetical protein